MQPNLYTQNMYTYTRHTFLFIIFLLTSLMSITVAAPLKRQIKRISVSQNMEKTVESYMDSLTCYKFKLDSVIRVNDSLNHINTLYPQGRYFRLFAPLNFYHSAVRSRLSFNTNTDPAIDNALLWLYISRPELVRYTDTQLQRREEASTPTTDNVAKPRYVDMKSRVVEVQPSKSDIDELRRQPIDMFVAKPNFWTFSGDYYLQVMQNYVTENWYKGGSNNYSTIGTVTLQYNYNNKQKVKWSNKLEMKLGLQTSESDTVNSFKAVEDLIRYTSNFGLQAHKRWYYTTQLVANTQFAQGRKDNKKQVFSDFMSPFNLNVSIGMDYSVNTNNNRLKGNVHLAPFAYNLKYVDRLALAKSFGLEEDHHSLSDFGSQFVVELDWTPSDMFKWRTRLYGYTTYHKYEMECENTLTFRFTKYITANLFLYPRFDDSAKRLEDYSYWQFKEYLSFGFSYSM